MTEAQAEVRKVFGNKGYVEESELPKLKYIDAVIKEILRLHPPLPLLVPRENFETWIIVNAWALGRDRKYWNEAEKFQSQRFLDPSTDYNFKGTNYQYISFGSGRRICPGSSFGYAVVDLAIAKLLYHFDWKLPDGGKHEDLDMEETSGNAASRKNHLCVVPTVVYHP
ncbi:cytochrome P450 71D10-like [Neltuma alba]|uniref:cytochrome P450 71D10-like n=1 Tax=Neltuma alba TaxID=207710 RepID=UPI0010A2B2A1|nr:cytochrome P450 71D10-like [Prosopis alba]